jgi:hypothetical protein
VISTQALHQFATLHASPEHGLVWGINQGVHEYHLKHIQVPVFQPPQPQLV